MSNLESRIVDTTTNRGHIQSLTAQIGSGLYIQAGGIGESPQVPFDPNLGFYRKWSAGWGGISIEDLTEKLGNFVAARASEVAKRRWQNPEIDLLILNSTTAPLGIEKRVVEVLEDDHGIKMSWEGEAYRNSYACGGFVMAATEAAMPFHRSKHVLAIAVETISDFVKHDPTMDNLFGDGYGVAAFESGTDMETLIVNTLLDPDKSGVLRIPHSLTNCLPPPEVRLPFLPNPEVFGPYVNNTTPGDVFFYQGGIFQPLQDSLGPANMNGVALLRYFAFKPVPVIRKTALEYQEIYGSPAQNQLIDPRAYMHEPSLFVASSLIRQLDKSNQEQPIFIPQHAWTRHRETLYQANNSSGATFPGSYVNLVADIQHRGLEPMHFHQLWTAMGVGHNTRSAVVSIRP